MKDLFKYYIIKKDTACGCPLCRLRKNRKRGQEKRLYRRISRHILKRQLKRGNYYEV